MGDADVRRLKLLRSLNEIDFQEIARWQAFARQCRADNPLPTEAMLSDVEHAQFQIVTDWLRQWLERYAASFSPPAPRTKYATPRRRMRLPVFSSNAPGLLAQGKFWPSAMPEITCLLDTEYNAWIQQNSACQFKSHWHFFCHFVAPPEPWQQERHFRSKLADAHVDYDPAILYWEQHSGAMFAGLAGGGEEIVWQWNGRKAEQIPGLVWGWIS